MAGSLAVDPGQGRGGHSKRHVDAAFIIARPHGFLKNTVSLYDKHSPHDIHIIIQLS